MEYCSSLGLRLLTIQNSKENYLMQEFFATEGKYLNLNLFFSSFFFCFVANEHKLINFILLKAQEAPPVWTSGTDLGSEGNWIWMSTGNLIQYSNWTIGEPSNTPIDNETEDCLQLNMIDGALKWDDCLCFSHKKVVCENIIF